MRLILNSVVQYFFSLQYFTALHKFFDPAEFIFTFYCMHVRHSTNSVITGHCTGLSAQKGAKDEVKWLASIADQVQGRLYRPERPKGAKDEVKWLASIADLPA